MTDWVIIHPRTTANSLGLRLCHFKCFGKADTKHIPRKNLAFFNNHVAARFSLEYALGWYPQIIATSIEALGSLMSVCCDPALGLQALERSSWHRSKSRPCA
jgi:hypothetical protein